VARKCLTSCYSSDPLTNHRWHWPQRVCAGRKRAVLEMLNIWPHAPSLFPPVLYRLPIARGGAIYCGEKDPGLLRMINLKQLYSGAAPCLCYATPMPTSAPLAKYLQGPHIPRGSRVERAAFAERKPGIMKRHQAHALRAKWTKFEKIRKYFSRKCDQGRRPGAAVWPRRLSDQGCRRLTSGL